MTVNSNVMCCTIRGYAVIIRIDDSNSDTIIILLLLLLLLL